MTRIWVKPMPHMNRTRRHTALQQEGVASLKSSLLWVGMGVGILVLTPIAYYLFIEQPLEAPYQELRADTDSWYGFESE